MTNEKLDFDIVFDQEDVEPVIKAAKEVGAQGVQSESQKGIVGLEWLIVGSVALPMLVNLAMKLAELWSVGVRIDMRTVRVKKTRDRDLPRGSILVITENGSELHKVAEMKLPDLTKAITKLLGL